MTRWGWYSLYYGSSTVTGHFPRVWFTVFVRDCTDAFHVCIVQVRMYHGRNLGELPPHVFALAESCYSNMSRHLKDQCCIIRSEEISRSDDVQCQRRHRPTCWHPNFRRSRWLPRIPGLTVWDYQCRGDLGVNLLLTIYKKCNSSGPHPVSGNTERDGCICSSLWTFEL